MIGKKNALSDKISKNVILGMTIILLSILVIILSACDLNDNSGNGIVDNNLGQCINYSVDECPSRCTVCPPCAECSSISCHDDKFCKDLGFNKTWYESVRPKPGQII